MNLSSFKWLGFCLILIFTYKLAQSQTIGLLHYDSETTEGYTLFTPEGNKKVFLINNCGEVVNQWLFNERPGNSCYLLENGNLLRAGKNSLEIRDWDNNTIWDFDMQAAGYSQHHDIEPLPNGNVLCILTDTYSDTEIIDAGRNPAQTGATFEIDKIIELQPVGVNGASLVWEWKFFDHFIQDFDNSKANYGTVENHPELIDLNYSTLTTDITHVNGIDYNEDLDQILLSARHMNEIYIIDHSTTTTEAAGHSGGTSNKGGDILWRWGNPEAYRQGTLSDQKLFLQHDAQWVKSGYLDDGKITVFNNGGDGTSSYSSIHLITPEIILNNCYEIENNTFKPSNYEWSWNGSILGITVQEGKKSGVHSLPNGNMVICETSLGRISEIKKDGTNLWTYINPTGLNNTTYNQFETNIANNTIFRGEKYLVDYTGLLGKDLTPKGIIENQNTNSTSCNVLNTSVIEFNSISIKNPIINNQIEFSQIVNLDRVTIYNINGQLIKEYLDFEGDKISISLPSSLYIIKLEKGKQKIYTKIIQP